MGHANFLGTDIEDALKRAQSIKSTLLRVRD
jgi:hypothetical protein